MTGVQTCALPIWQDRGNQNNESSLTLHNALQPTAHPFVPAVNASNHTHLNVPHTSRSDYPDLSAIVSPLITTTATSHPAFFDDREHLITGLGVDNTERGRFASTSLPNMVTDLSNTVYMSPITNTSPPEELMSSTTRPNTTEASNEIIMKGNRRTNVTVSLPAKSGAGLTITTTAPTYRNYGDAEDGFRLLQQHNQQTLKTGYIPPPITSNQTPRLKTQVHRFLPH